MQSYLFLIFWHVIKIISFVSFASTSSYFFTPKNKLKQTYPTKHTNLNFFFKE